MKVTCPECDRRFKVPEDAAGRKVRCPGCERIMLVPRQSAADEMVDRSKRRAGTGQGKKSTAHGSSGPDRRLLIATGVTAVVLLGGVIWFLNRGGGATDGSGPALADLSAEGTPLSGGKVVFTEPLSSLPKQEERQPPPPVSFEPPLAAVALLPEASAGDAVGGDVGEWQGQPDPIDEPPKLLPPEALVHLHNQEPPLLASLGGPFVLEHRGDLSRMPDSAVLEDPNAGKYALEVKDLRTGKAAGRFSWKVPVWPGPKHTVDARLSPDGRYVVGPDNKEGIPATRKDGLLFVWEREKPEPVGRLKIPGSILWLDFVANDKVAALTFDQTPVLQVWSVASVDSELSVRLPESEFKEPEHDVYTYQAPEPGDKTYAVDAMIGAVSPGGSYVALGGSTAVHVVSLGEGKVVGALPFPRKRLWPQQEPGDPVYLGLAFNDAGDELYGLLKAQRSWLLSWSLESGLLTSAAMPLDVAELRGPPIPGTEPGTVIIPDYQFTDGAVLQALMTQQGAPFATGAVIEVRSGKLLSPISWRPIRRNGDGVLALTSLKYHPELPPPPGFNPNSEFLTNLDRQRARETWIVKTAEFDRERIREQLAKIMAETGRPAARTGVREGLVAVRPTPPASWTSPPKPPVAPQGLIGALNVPNTRPLFGDSHVGFICSFVPPEDPKRVEELRFKARSGDQSAIAELSAMAPTTKGVLWLRYDLRTGQRMEPVELGPLGTSEAAQAIDFARTPLAAAMTRDGERLALRDPTDMSRIDVWDTRGVRSLSFLPYGPATPVQWVGWSPGSRLLTLGGGKFTSWEVSDGNAVFEVEGNYRLPVSPVRGGGWLAVSAGPHIDLIDAESGACLGRCSVPTEELDLSHPTDVALTPDGGYLMHFGWRKPQDWDAMGIVTVWDLATGVAQTSAKVPSVPSGVFASLDGRRVGGFDLKAEVAYVKYIIPTPKTPEYAPYPNGVLPGSPDGRGWVFGPEDTDPERRRVMLRPLELPIYDAGPADPAFVFTRTTPLVVEVEMGDEKRSRAFGENLLRALQSQGFRIGKGGWTLRASCELRDSESSLMTGSGGKVNVPEAVIHWKLYAPDGELAHTTTKVELGSGRKYFQGQRVVSQKGIETVIEYTWEFPDGDPHQAMLEELLSDLATKGDVNLVYPIGKFQGKYQLLPVEVQAVFPQVDLPAN